MWGRHARERKTSYSDRSKTIPSFASSPSASGSYLSTSIRRDPAAAAAASTTAGGAAAAVGGGAATGTGGVVFFRR